MTRSRKTPASAVTSQRVEQHIVARFSPIRNLTPEKLARALDEFNGGFLREFALMASAIESRDDVIKCVAPKRRAAISAKGYRIQTDPSAPPSTALKHKQVLEYFYRNLEATNAIDGNQLRGFSLLCEQMLQAIGHKYAVHEILWQPSGEGLTARFNYVPLWFFENRTGKLRFLPHEYAIYGEDLRPAGWMVTVGEGIMEACAVAYMFKHLPLKDWLLYCEKHGMPGVHGKTTAPYGSEGWNNVVQAVSEIAADFSTVTDADTTIEKIDFGATGDLPFPGIVDRMDRVLAALWRGADLSTKSAGAGQGQGASVQADESWLLETQDARLVTETLQMTVDPLVIEWNFGGGVKPAAWIEVVVPEKIDFGIEIQKDKFLLEAGAPLGVRSTLERYGRTMPAEGEDLLKPVSPQQAPPGAAQSPSGPTLATLFANERAALVNDSVLIAAAMDTAAEETARALAPLRQRIDAVLGLQSDPAFVAGLKRLQIDLPEILMEINKDPANAETMQGAMTAGLFNGMADAITRKLF